MRKLILSLIATVLAHISTTATASCVSISFPDAQAGNVIVGNTVSILWSGTTGDSLFIDGAWVDSLPIGDPWETIYGYYETTLPYGSYVATVSSEPCSESFTLVSPPTAPPGQQFVYRFYRRNGPGTISDHFSVLDYNEGAGLLNGTYEGVYFKTHTTQEDGNMVPLYRCYGYWGDHFADTDPSCGGNTVEGSYGYISTIPRAGYTELYRFVRLNPWDFIETTSWDEVVNWQQGGYGVLGYVPQ